VPVSLLIRKVAKLPRGLTVAHLDFSYGRKQVLKDVNFSIDSGRFCALLGPNGAGKTTLFSLLTGLIRAEVGQIEVCGMDLADRPRDALARMGIVFQQTTLDLDLSVRHNLSYYAALRGIYGRDANLRIDAALDRMGLADRAMDRARDLNGGHRRRTEIARALMHKPDILLLDEPTVGLDPQSRAGITDYVHDLCSNEELTVLWATHLVDEVRPDDDLVVLNHGRVLANGTASEVTAGEVLNDVFLKMTGQPA
jgi:ABC-2 type transport system ATP-binding protein